ncbi:MAG: hypothetical protein PHF00_04940, partial [Elusimicrobia bacterium]|nr:hypothetical protein [Elusimicrobiota bacterium]
WAGEARAGMVYRYIIVHCLTGTSLTPLNQYPLPGAAPGGLFSSGGLLWVLDSATRKLTRYRFDAAGLTPADETNLSGALTGPPASMTLSPDALWVLVSSPPSLHRFALDRLSWKAASGSR